MKKFCNQCRQELPVESFGLWKYAKDGRRPYCRVCRSRLRRESRQRNGMTVRKVFAKTDEGFKYCVKCEKVKPLNSFNPDKKTTDGRGSWCKECLRDRQREQARAAGIKEKRKRDPALLAAGMKECFSCNEVYLLAAFSPSERGYGGVAAFCKRCYRDYMRATVTPEKRARNAAYSREYRRNNELWRKMHSEQQTKRRRILLKQDSGLVTAEILKGLYETVACYYCEEETPPERRTVDHKTPLTKGGLHHPDNLAMACLSCNSSKQDKTEEEFRGVLSENRERQHQPIWK